MKERDQRIEELCGRVGELRGEIEKMEEARAKNDEMQNRLQAMLKVKSCKLEKVMEMIREVKG